MVDETVDFDDAQFMPLATLTRFNFFGSVTLGAKIDYALEISNFIIGDFYFRLVVGVNIADAIELNASYKSNSDVYTWAYLI